MSDVSHARYGERRVTLESGIGICLRDIGDPATPAIMLISGLGEDLTFWSSSFVAALVSRGFRVITMDNRDVGRSTFVDAPAPPLWRQLLTRPRRDAYSLTDMANDVVGVLDHLEINRVHLVGRSMGGMIAQTLAAAEPARVLSLTSIYSTTGAKRVGRPSLSTIRLLAAPSARTRTAAVCAHLRITRHIAGTAYPIDDVEEAALAARAWDRSARDPAAGVARQIQAIQASGDRTPQLRTITAPTLVINGDRDLMVSPSGGSATVAAINPARHLVIPGMGHHLPDSLTDPITQLITEHAHRATQGGHHVELT